MAIKYTYPPQRRFAGNKYNAVKHVVDGITFDSGHEADRYRQLKILERAGKISDLQTQVKFELIPSQKNAIGRVIEKPCSYYADFVYKDANGVQVVEDAKGDKQSTAYSLFVIKRKLMLYRYGIRVIEV